MCFTLNEILGERIKKPLRMRVPFNRNPQVSLDSCNVFRFGAFRAVNDFKADCLAFGQRLETISLDGRIVNKHVTAIFLGKESKAFGLLNHFTVPFTILLHLLADKIKIEDYGIMLYMLQSQSP